MPDTLDLDALDRIREAATPGDWTVYERVHEPRTVRPFPLRNLKPKVEFCIGTAADHPQLHGPAPIVDLSTSPYYEDASAFVQLSREDAAQIVSAVNSQAGLIAEIRRLRTELKLIGESEPHPCGDPDSTRAILNQAAARARAALTNKEPKP